MNFTKLKIFCDGGARGNPGPAAVGVVIYSDDRVVSRISERIGETTNNIAEYTAVIKALEKIIEMKIKPENIIFHLDSMLVAKQLAGEWKIKISHLKILFIKVKQLETNAGGKIIYTYIPREKNTAADALVNLAFELT